MPTTEQIPADRPHVRSHLMTVGLMTLLMATPAVAQDTQVNVSIGIEIETRGPVHEAFAEPVIYDPEPGIIVPQEPPPLIDEIPPDEHPPGDSVTWIPGYWSWDDERSTFLWVSGTWRSLPPGRQFVPGYWARTVGGYQWVPGAWLNASSEALEYLPEPPAPIGVEPVGAPPASDYIWVPGAWLWRDGRYLWRPGYWIAPQPDWVWVPAHYVWTPSGYLFVSGYWDHRLSRRGLLFAPAYIERTVLARPAFVYRPTVVIDTRMLVDHLFARPRYRHYYFGDYYAPEYQRAGIMPVYAFHRTPRGYSPLYAHTVAVHRRSDPQWERQFVRQYEIRRDRPDARPPRTWTALQRARAEHAAASDTARFRSLTFARSLSDLAHPRDPRETPIPVRRIAPEQREDARRRLTQLREYQNQRRQLELSWAARSPLRPSGDQPREGTVDPGPDRDRPERQPPRIQRDQPGQRGPQRRDSARSLRLTLPRSPVAGRPARQLDRTTAPPARPKVPGVDPNARPQPRAQPRERTGGPGEP